MIPAWRGYCTVKKNKKQTLSAHHLFVYARVHAKKKKKVNEKERTSTQNGDAVVCFDDVLSGWLGVRVIV